VPKSLAAKSLPLDFLFVQRCDSQALTPVAARASCGGLASSRPVQGRGSLRPQARSFFACRCNLSPFSPSTSVRRYRFAETTGQPGCITQLAAVFGAILPRKRLFYSWYLSCVAQTKRRRNISQQLSNPVHPPSASRNCHPQALRQGVNRPALFAVIPSQTVDFDRFPLRYTLESVLP